MNDIDELLSRGVANIIPSKEELKKKLESGKLNIYLGIDPTAPQIHLGHTVALRKLQKFAEIGHNVTLLIGDFTALIGDTSDKESERPSISSEQIEENFKTYKQQAEKILDFSKVKIKYNSEWLKDLTFLEIIKLCQLFSVGDFVSRELIRKRLDDGKRVGLHEFLYPVMQAYDSLTLRTDIQLGGTDQTFNMQAGRTLIKATDNRESFVLTTPILEGTDGRKMSKTYGNAIWLNDEPSEMYAKIMRVEDNLIINYFTLVTNISFEEIKKIEEEFKNENPIIIKKKLARAIVSELYDDGSADKAEKDFESRVQNKELPEEITELSVKKDSIITQVLTDTGFAGSISEAKRLIGQGGVNVNDKKIENADEKIEEGILRVGKRKIVKISIN